MNKSELIDAVADATGITKSDAGRSVEAVLGAITSALQGGDQVTLVGFGTFSVRDKNARMGRNPKTGEEVPITPRRVLSFRPSHLMKDRVAAGNRR